MRLLLVGGSSPNVTIAGIAPQSIPASATAHAAGILDAPKPIVPFMA